MRDSCYDSVRTVRLVDLEIDDVSGRVSAVMLPSDGNGYYWYRGITEGQIDHLARGFASRIIEWISDPSCHLAEQRIVGVVEGEQKGRAMTAPAEGPAQGRAAQAAGARQWGNT